MQAICEAYGAKFFRFLQPCLCSPENPIEDLDANLMQMIEQISSALGASSEIYSKRVYNFYAEVLDTYKTDNGIYNILDILPSSSDLWSDSRHPTDQGYLQIARKIYCTLNREGIYSNMYFFFYRTVKFILNKIFKFTLTLIRLNNVKGEVFESGYKYPML